MAYDLEEQEQLDEIRAWWKRYGNLVTWVALALATGFAAYQGWNFYQQKQATEASMKFESLREFGANDNKAIQAISGELIEKYSSTPYAGRAALTAAKMNVELKDFKSAKSQLEWASKNAKEDAIKSIAILQLASLNYAQKDYEGALKSLSEAHDAAFDGLYADLKGDILVAQNKKSEAKVAYTEAISKLDADGIYIQYTQHKLEALGI